MHGLQSTWTLVGMNIILYALIEKDHLVDRSPEKDCS